MREALIEQACEVRQAVMSEEEATQKLAEIDKAMGSLRVQKGLIFAQLQKEWSPERFRKFVEEQGYAMATIENYVYLAKNPASMVRHQAAQANNNAVSRLFGVGAFKPAYKRERTNAVRQETLREVIKRLRAETPAAIIASYEQELLNGHA